MNSRSARAPTAGAPRRNQGSIALVRTGFSQVEISRRIGKVPSTVNRYLTGEICPDDETRVRIEQVFGVGRGLWDQEPVRAPMPEPSEVSEVTGGAFAMAASLQKSLQRQLNRLQTDGENWSPAEAAKVGVSLASGIAQLAKLTGEADIQKKLFELPATKEFERLLFEVLADHPEIAEKLRARLIELKGKI